MNRLRFRVTLGVLIFVVSGVASAIGLGELRGQPVLGERLELTLSILGADKSPPSASCFRLVRPRDGDALPWLRQADFRVVPGKQPLLVISTHEGLREPVVQLSIYLACGHEIQREYTLLASPRFGGEVDPVVTPPSKQDVLSRQEKRDAGQGMQRHRQSPTKPQLPKAEKLPVPVALVPPASSEGYAEDRLLLSANEIDTESALRLSLAISERMLAGELAEAQREVLRLEFRMLMALHEQAASQLEAAEKLRNMEATLGELQGRTLVLTDSVNASPASTATPPVDGQRTQPVSQVPENEDSILSEWWLYGLIAGFGIGLVAWLLWRSYRERSAPRGLSEFVAASPEPTIDAPRAEEREEKGGVDLHLETSSMGAPLPVDVELGGGGGENSKPVQQLLQARPGDSVLSINATTLDEHFEANPVMELADIMLSFGRVKGAAQALQEYIDNNPQEALQPWIRLMDVYRMAGMREEFDAVARNLNQHFNVEVQSWEAVAGGASVDLVLEEAGDATEGVLPPKAKCLEDMPRIMGGVVRMWDSEDVVGYLYQLLRDNRGGQRQGFALPVVEEILFLIELKETANRMEKEMAKHG